VGVRQKLLVVFKAIRSPTAPNKGTLAVNDRYTVNDNKKRAVGFKLSDGLEVPEELDGRFTFARMKSKLAGTNRGSYFVVKGEY
jgi:hypothetical protein